MISTLDNIFEKLCYKNKIKYIYMNNNTSNESMPSYDEIINNYEDINESLRLTERRNAVKPYIPKPKTKCDDLIEVKEPKKRFLFCCKFI